MYGDMKAGFLQGAGVDPARMKVVLLALVFAVVLVIAAWISAQLAEGYGSGELEKAEVVRALVLLLVLVLVLFSFLAWL
ncbi:DUF3262 family protein [Xylophilus sp. ASV27]|uniref:DUF3262 family protein n=1 Tax=Xylophilus sp. ASV27 TaxID=2795129 RepID=UPI0018EBC591|nr:DUF3262 family protein [Xylophilus sp. ASV27]